MRVVSWNVDGLSRCATQVVSFAREWEPQLFALNEIKCSADRAASLLAPLLDEGYRLLANPCGGGRLSASYHGVALLIAPGTRVESGSETLRLAVPNELEERVEADPEARQMLFHEGRCIGLSVAVDDVLTFFLFTYVPNAGTKGLARLALRTEVWDACLLHTLRAAREAGRELAWVGDLNVVADPRVDLYTGRARRYAGVTAEERESFAAIREELGLRDAFCSEGRRDRFTFFSARGRDVRAEAKGWRLDYALLSGAGHSWTTPCDDERSSASDHNPLFLEIGDGGGGAEDGAGGAGGAGAEGADPAESAESADPASPELNETEEHMMVYLNEQLHSFPPGSSEHGVVHGAIRHLLGDRYFAWWSSGVLRAVRGPL